MDRSKWRIKKVGRAWGLYSPGSNRPYAFGSWLFCVSRLKELQYPWKEI